MRLPILLGLALSLTLHESCRAQELSQATETTIDNSLVGRYRVEGEETVVTIEPAGDELVVNGRLETDLPEELRGPRKARAPLVWDFPLVGVQTRGLDGVLTHVQAGTHAPEELVELRSKGNGRIEGAHRKSGSVVATFTLVRQAANVKLYLYPGESTRGGTTIGHIYVVGGKGESYEIAAGPPDASSEVGAGGHSAGVTPAGTYTLGAQEHHTTLGWPNSSIPWGATLEKKDDDHVYYSITPGKWVQVTGPGGVLTKSLGQFWDNTPSASPLRGIRREDFVNQTSSLYGADGKLVSPWTQNDFGEWSWNLTRNGARTPYYVHTTPDDEERYRAGASSALFNSHGCVHLHPKDRDEMMAKGYLSAGVEVIVKPYGQLGPPGASKKQLNNALGE